MKHIKSFSKRACDVIKPSNIVTEEYLLIGVAMWEEVAAEPGYMWPW